MLLLRCFYLITNLREQAYVRNKNRFFCIFFFFSHRKNINLTHVLSTHSKQSGRRAFRRKDRLHRIIQKCRDFLLVQHSSIFHIPICKFVFQIHCEYCQKTIPNTTKVNKRHVKITFTMLAFTNIIRKKNLIVENYSTSLPQSHSPSISRHTKLPAYPTHVSSPL